MFRRLLEGPPGRGDEGGPITVGIDDMFAFHDYVRITGWAHKPGVPLARAEVRRGRRRVAKGRVGLPRAGVALGTDLGFAITLLCEPWYGQGHELVLTFADGARRLVSCDQVYALPSETPDVLFADQRDPVFEAFHAELQDPRYRSILEVGSRARMQVVRKHLFAHLDYVGIDILEGENVDVVGDAHDLRNVLGGRTFDAVFSTSVFEHLAMPWKVAIALNQVLAVGAIGYVEAPQTIGLHDLPWDFWRFSDVAWHSLFNANTGFEVLQTALLKPNYIVPFVLQQEWAGYERAAGFAASAVMFRKVADTELSWDVPLEVAARGVYPA